MGDWSQASVSCSAHPHGASSTCSMCQEAARRRSARSGGTAGLPKAGSLVKQLERENEGLRVIVYMMLKDRGGAFVADRVDLQAAEQEIFQGATLVSEEEPDTHRYILRILDKQ